MAKSADFALLTQLLLLIILGPLPSSANQLALLTGTLQTFQRHACDGSTLQIECPNDTKIDIIFAQYGQTPTPREGTPQLCPVKHGTPPAGEICHFPEGLNYTTLQRVVKICQQKSGCEIPVEPATFDLRREPCPHTTKYIEVAFKCRPDCQASFATETVMQQCHGKRHCYVRADSNVYGRPCSPQSNMYMRTAYTCVPLKVLKTKFKSRQHDYFDEPVPGTTSHPKTTPVPAKVPDSTRGISNDILPLDKGPTKASSPDPVFNPTVWIPKERGPPQQDEQQHINGSRRRKKPDLINCTITIISGSREPQIGLITEWMRAIAFIKKNFEKFILYLILGLCGGLVTFLVVVVGRLYLDKRRVKEEAKMMHDPLTSVFATADIDDIDGELEISGPARSSTIGGSPPSVVDPRPSQAASRYSTASRSGLRRQDSDLHPPRSLSSTNNSQLFYS